MQLTKYFASLGFDIDKSSVKKVDKALDHIENRLKKLGTFANKPIILNLGNFDVDQKKLNLALGTALDMASSRLVFQIDRFDVNQAALNRSIGLAMVRAGATHPLRPNIAPSVGGGRAREAAVTGVAAGAVRGRGMPSLFGPAIALGLGGYGIGALNRRNQEVVSAQLQSSAVVQQAGGTAEQGQASFDYLRKTANRVGFNYLDASADYNTLLSNVTGSGRSVEEGQKIFTGFSELSRTLKLGKVQQQRVFKALSDISGKGQLQAQELKLQLGQALPGAQSLFAEAYQKELAATGKGRGDLTGQAAIQALLDAMKKGQVKSSVLKYAAEIASERASKTLPTASQASQAEQAKYQNTISDLAVVASDSGVEEGFARIFRTLNSGLSEGAGLVKTLAEGFNDATKFADDLLLFPQSFVRALEGKDSVVADFLGIDKTEQLRKDWMDIKQIFTDISTIKFDFLPTLEATAKEIAAIFNAIAEFQKFKSGNLPTTETNNSSTEKANFLGFEYASPAAIVGDILNNTGVNLNKARDRGRAVYEDPSSPYYHDAAGYDDQQAEMAKAAADDKANGIVTNNSNQIDIVVNVDGSTLQGLDANAQAQAIGEAVANMFVQSFDQVNVQFPVK